MRRSRRHAEFTSAAHPAQCRGFPYSNNRPASERHGTLRTSSWRAPWYRITDADTRRQKPWRVSILRKATQVHPSSSKKPAPMPTASSESKKPWPVLLAA